MSCDGEQNLGELTYEIDGFLCGAHRSDSGRIEGGAAMLAKAVRAGAACIVLSDGQLIDIVFVDPRGEGTAEFTVRGRFPRFGEVA